MPDHPHNPDALPTGSEALCTRNHRYRLERVLGQGGFGITYLATCLQDFHPSYREGEVIRAGSKLAIKECFPRDFAFRHGNTVCPRGDRPGSDLQLEEKSAMFLQEAETLAHLSASCKSDNLVPIYHCGRLEQENITFFVMPYMEGGSLGNYAGSLSATQVADILYQLLGALGHCHRLHEPLLHLDIKPDNVMMTRSGNRLIPVLIDFGLARPSNGGDVEVRGLTRGYAPWEQTMTDSWNYVGPWTDVYALGATLYAVITGEKPPSCEKRPPLAQQVQDSYTPLHQRPELLARFREANSEGGERLLWSIDVALNPVLGNSREGSTDAQPPRWQDANSWLRAAFPHGAWPEPKDTTAAGGSFPLKAALAICLPLLILLVVLINLADSGRPDSPALPPTPPAATDSTPEEPTTPPTPAPLMPGETVAQTEQEPDSPPTTDETTPAPGATPHRPDLFFPGIESTPEPTPGADAPSPDARASTSSRPVCVIITPDGQLDCSSDDAESKANLLYLWRNRTKADIDRSADKPQTLLQLLYAWQHTESPHTQATQMRLQQEIEKAISAIRSSDDPALLVVKAYYLRAIGKPRWQKIFLSAQLPDHAAENIRDIAAYLRKDIPGMELTVPTDLDISWRDGKPTCSDAERARCRELAQQCTPRTLIYMQDDADKARLLSALIIAAEADEHARNLLDGATVTGKQPNALLVFCSYRYASGLDWASEFCEHFLEEDRRVFSLYHPLRQQLVMEGGKVLLNELTEETSETNLRRRARISKIFLRLNNDTDRAALLSRMIELMEVPSLLQEAIHSVENTPCDTYTEMVTILKNTVRAWPEQRQTRLKLFLHLLTSLSPTSVYSALSEQDRIHSLALIATQLIIAEPRQQSELANYLNRLSFKSNTPEYFLALISRKKLDPHRYPKYMDELSTVWKTQKYKKSWGTMHDYYSNLIFILVFTAFPSS